MPNDYVSKALSSPTKTLGYGLVSAANKAFPQSKPPAHVAVTENAATAVKPATPAPTLSAELKAKSDNVSQYTDAPKMHNGGPVRKTGVYTLKKGEHVLTEDEAKQARRHALMASGVSSLAKVIPNPPGPKFTKKTSGEPEVTDAAHKKSEKKTTANIKVRPEKNQNKQVPQQMKKA